jgi:NADH:ubiquinone oxidoreductase subunit 2 (subunit N)
VYYLRVSIVMWSPAPANADGGRRLRVPGPVAGVAVIGGVGIVLLAVLAQPVIDLCQGAAQSLIP